MLLRLSRLLAALALFAAAPALGQAKHDTLTIGMTQFPSTLNPLIDSMLAKTYVLAMTRRPLMAFDAKWENVCLLCVEVPSFANGLAKEVDLGGGKKGVAVTLTIQPKASWGDGTPVSTTDVAFTIKVGQHPQSGIASAEFYRRIVKLDIKDEKTFTLTLDRITFDYNQIALELLPAHIEEKAFAEPAEYRHRTFYDRAPTNPGLYMGPYRITEVAPGSHIVLEPNPTWYGQKPYFKRIVVRVIENTAALEANLLSGAIDYVAGELGLSLEQVLALEQRHKDKFRFVYKPGLVYEHLDVNLDNPILKDKRVRQALLYAADRAKISAQLFQGKQPVANSNVNPLDWMVNPDTPAYRYDPAKAKKLLEEAGWTELRGGIRYDKQGRRLSITLMTTSGNRTRELVEQILQSQWRQVGIDARIQNQPARVFFGTTVTQRKFEGLALFAWLSSPESVPRSTLHSSMIPTAANNWSGQNSTGYANPEMDKLLDAIERELDREKRKALWYRLQMLYAEDLPALPLYFRADGYVLPPWLHGVVPTGHQGTSTLWVEQWRAE
ncbi:MAG: peptide ABC transporter substrate-binding protein [Rhodospirillaceae bacterium]|nr:peptide ABC transporter substrate-binding protein [Rhodospirillaceae bacterium]